MKKHIFALTVIILTTMLSASIGGTLYADPRNYEFNDSSKPGTLMIVSGLGDITIEGYSGKTVQIANASGEELETPENNEKAKGMKRIAGSKFSISKSPDDNAIVISRSIKSNTDLVVKVPFNTHIKIGKNNGSDAVGSGTLENIVAKSIQLALNIQGGMDIMIGTIEIRNITGNIEAGTLAGDITITKASGTVMANSLKGSITVTFATYPVDTPMAFSTIGGDVDVTFPANLKAIVTAKTIDGEIYTDFDLDFSDDAKQDVTDKNKADNTGTFDLMSMGGTTVTGKIGGGGQDVNMSTINGDIYIRKAK